MYKDYIMINFHIHIVNTYQKASPNLEDAFR